MKAKQQRAGGGASILVGALLFALVLVFLASGTLNLAAGASEEGAATTRTAIEQAAVLCYATEGFYPPGLSYIEEHYKVQIDYERYSVRYEVYAANVMPLIRVVPRGSGQ